MENLVQKINEHTASGPPSVSELVELQELAHSLKVPRSKLEKMIADAISFQKNKEVEDPLSSDDSPIETSYERPDYDAVRNSFDAEMSKRDESDSMFKREEIEFNRPEIVFKKTEDPFATKEEIEQEVLEEATANPVVGDETNLHFDAYRDSLFEDEKPIDSNRGIGVPNQNIDENETEQERIEQEKATVGDNRIDILDSVKEVNEETIGFEETVEDVREERDKGAKSEPEASEEINPFSFVDEFESLENNVRKEELNAWVTNSNRKERERAEELARVKLTEEKRSFERDDANYGATGMLEDAKGAFTLGIVALVVSVIFGYIGGVIGIFAMVKSNEGLQKFKINPKSFVSGSLSKLKNARTMGIIAIVVSVFKIFRIFFWGFYPF